MVNLFLSFIFMPTQEPTNQELLKAIKSNDRRIDDVLEAVNSFATHVDEEFKNIRSTIVTKAQLKEKISELKSDLVTEIDRFIEFRLSDYLVFLRNVSSIGISS